MVETKEVAVADLAVTSPTPPCASLYVGDLDASVTESDLIRAFSCFGPISSARVCRDSASGLSLCYAYLNFLSHFHAEKALKTLNHVTLLGKPMRIMWSHRDPLPRKTGIGNLFVKNLDASVSGVELEDLFKKYGMVVSCKVATDEKGRNKGFGFVQLDSEEAAQSAIQDLNGLLFHGGSKKLYVSKFIKKREGQAPPEEPNGANLYIKNLDCDCTDNLLREKFSIFGKVISAAVMKNEHGKSRGFGFVSFELPEHAKKAMGAMNGAQLGSRSIYVGQAQKKAEREELLKLQFAERPDQCNRKIQGSNLYVKNLGDSVDDKALQSYFARCGTILSTKVMYDVNGQSRGFGFVCFSSPNSAKKAISTLHETMFHDKCLHVAIAQCKEDRLNALQLQFPKTLPVQNSVSTLHGSSPPRYYSAQYQNPAYQMLLCQQYSMGHSFRNQGFGFGSSPTLPHQHGKLAYPYASCANKVSLLRTPSQHPSFASQLHHTVQTVNPQQGIHHMRPARYGQYGDSNHGYFVVSKSYSPVRGMKKTHYPEGPSYQRLKALESALAVVDPKKQKQMIGEHLYPLVQKLEFKRAGKITSMLLEMNSTELHKILLSPKLQAERITEVVQVLNRRVDAGKMEHDDANSVA